MEQIEENQPKVEEKQTYFTHDNGGRAFKVEFKTGEPIFIFIDESDLEIDDIDEKDERRFTEKVFTIEKYEKVFVGFDSCDKEWSIGNSILVHIDKFNYIYIGTSIYSFEANDEIVQYNSPVGRSDVIYSWCIDKSNMIYLLIENRKFICTKEQIESFDDFSVSDLVWSKNKKSRDITMKRKMSDECTDPYDLYYNKQIPESKIKLFITKEIVEREWVRGYPKAKPQIYHTNSFNKTGYRVEIFRDKPIKIYYETRATKNVIKSTDVIKDITNYEKIFIGYDTCDKKSSLGNSILVQIKGLEYIFIGEEMFSFVAKDEISEYHSIIAKKTINPYGIDNLNNVYLLKEKIVFHSARDLISTFNDKVCSELYEEKPKKKSKITKKRKQIKPKIENSPYKLFYDKKIDDKDIEKIITQSVLQEI